MPAERDPVDRAVQALRHRDRSRAELDERLARAGVDETARADALERLERIGYIDDGRFAATRAAALAGRGYGDAAIRHDLAGRGIGPEAATAAIAVLEPESARAGALVARLGRSPKTAAHLARKGFGRDAVEGAVGTDVALGDA
jgi:regulatory protein